MSTWGAVSDWKYEENGCDRQLVGFGAETVVGDLFTRGTSINTRSGGKTGVTWSATKRREEIGCDGKVRQLHVAAREKAQIQQSKLCLPCPLPPFPSAIAHCVRPFPHTRQ